MVKTSRQVWLELNNDRYECSVCGFTSPNLSHFKRHLKSDKHWLMTQFRMECPRDLKVMVASFLPFVKLTDLGQLGLDAVTMAIGPPIVWLDKPRRVIQRVDPVGLPARTVYLGGHSRRNLRSLAFVL